MREETTVWTCAACGRANEAHALFCGACAGMRSGVRPLTSARETEVEPEDEHPPLPPPRPIRWTFVLWWTAATALAQVLSTVAMGVVSVFVFIPVATRGFSDNTLLRILVGILYPVVTASITSGAQVCALSRYVPGRRWLAWVPATCAASGLAALVLSLFPPVLLRGELDFDVRWSVQMVIYGALPALAQVMILRRRLPGPPWRFWIWINILAIALITLVTHLLLPREITGSFWLNYLRLYLFSAVLYGGVTGAGLAWLLRRALSEVRSS